MIGANKKKLLPKPNEVPPVPGAEDWREMYPQSLTFDDGSYPDAVTWENKQFWVQNNVHYPKALRPLNELFCEGDQLWFGQSVSRVYVFPECKGAPYRVLNGYIYNTTVSYNDPKIITERSKVFAARWRYVLANWDSLVKAWEQKVRATISEIERLNFPDLPDIFRID